MSYGLIFMRTGSGWVFSRLSSDALFLLPTKFSDILGNLVEKKVEVKVVVEVKEKKTTTRMTIWLPSYNILHSLR